MRQSTSNQILITESNPHSPISEAYRSLRTNIQFSAIDTSVQVVMVGSAVPGEGKSTTAANLAIVYAQEGKKVLLMDCDLRKPTVHARFAVHNRNGLTNVLSGNFTAKDIYRDTGVENLTVITSGPIPPNPSEMLASKKMTSLMEQFREEFDMIVLDTPPILAVTDALIVSSFSDGVLLVINSTTTKRSLVQKAKSSLDHVHANMLGVVLNNKKRADADTEYYYYYGADAK
ncbi:capsular biosynthesis protein [Paenibacillus swuensis]|uniref:non-specific protein-tyrosine kinase n=1 Tax=Paenibacillus swuensis TaxID=1178515 RepID=A0A172TH66_9BACL|nr:CpsD/CapB family tyrosine-protein kinase [Paenibacillus swuensis]ANE46398.1 capsular biosynthesis protein [Paenibacillus swuensis]